MKKVMMLLANGVEPLEMAAFSDVLGWAVLVGNEAIELIDVGMQPRIKTTFGLQLQPNYLLQDVDLTLLEKISSKNNADDLRKIMRIPTPSTTWLQTPQV